MLFPVRTGDRRGKSHDTKVPSQVDFPFLLPSHRSPSPPLSLHRTHGHTDTNVHSETTNLPARIHLTLPACQGIIVQYLTSGSGPTDGFTSKAQPSHQCIQSSYNNHHHGKRLGCGAGTEGNEQTNWLWRLPRVSVKVKNKVSHQSLL